MFKCKMSLHTNDLIENDLVCEALQNLESTIYYYTIDYKDGGGKEMSYHMRVNMKYFRKEM